MMRTTVSIHVVRLSAGIQIYFLLTSTQQQQQSSSHRLKHMITTNFWLIWLADCCLSLCLSVQPWSLSPSSSHSFTEESSTEKVGASPGNTGSLLSYWLCLIQNCWNQHTLTPTLYSPQSLQSTVWTLLKINQLLHVWLLQVVLPQIQLSQMWGRVGLQSWGQIITADLWQTAVSQPK